MFKLDELDLKLLELIQRNPKIKLHELERTLKSPKSTIHYRLKKLEELGVIKGYRALLDAEKLGFQFNVVILVRAVYGPQYHYEVGRLLSENPYVQAVYYILGDIDFVVIGKFPSRDSYLRFLESLINSGRVERTSTMVVIKTLKEDMILKLGSEKG